jgi:S-adenosylmethionine-diacylglycerol 3-amino-3-carboxypropyl transferase
MDNEDSRSELTALEIGPADTVVAVAAGGGRALSLLAAGPARLVAVDRRVEQLHTLELKAAALGALEYEDLLAFAGVSEGPDRLDQYAALRGSLTPGARRYWDARRALVAEGCLYAGRLEQALRRASAALRPLGLLRWVEPFFAAPALEAQRALLAARRARVVSGLRPWRLIFHPALVYAAAQDPGFLRSTEGSVGRYVVQRFERWLAANLARESFLLHFLYHGRLHPWGPLPVHLSGEGAARARKHLDRLELRCADLGDVAHRARDDEPTKWSLSDVSCWMSEDEFHRLVRAIAARGAPGSRLCARHFAARRALPPDLPASVQRLAALAAALELRDASIIYTFAVAEWPAGEDAASSRAQALALGRAAIEASQAPR